MKLCDALNVLLFSNVTIFTDTKRCQIIPTKNLDETGRKYLTILSPEILGCKVTKIVPTAFGYVNVYIEMEI